MRLLIILSAVILTACTSTKQVPAANNSNVLNGTWVPVQQEIGGNTLPEAAFQKQVLTIKDSTYSFMAESLDKGVLSYKDDKMDIYGREGVNAGRHFMAIYKFENQQLTICYNLKGDSYPASYDTKGHPLYFLSVFRKTN
ncbi:MAG: TIGR03067 domain-containing protein [Ferruginibacter sp.]